MGDYNDIINLPHHTSKVHPRMSMLQRAAQFAPFAALTGHDAAIRETARLTDSQLELDNDENERLNQKLLILRDHLKEHPLITATYFLPDTLKSGGSYQTVSGSLRNIDDYEQKFIMLDGTEIPLSSVFEIDSKLFDNVDESQERTYQLIKT